MAWIESHDTLGRHPKTEEAARLLGIGIPQMIGHLHLLWWWCMEYAQNGDLTGFRPTVIARAAGWDGEPESFVAALIECGPTPDKPGFLERTHDGRLLVHDWWDYAGKLIEKRRANRERMRSARHAHVQDTCSTRATHMQDMYNTRAGATVPNQTVPNQTSSPLPPTGGDEEGSWLDWYEQEFATSPPTKHLEEIGQKKAEGMADGVIIEALRRAREARARNVIAYANQVLGNWYAAGVRRLDDLRHLDEAAAARASPGPPMPDEYPDLTAKNAEILRQKAEVVAIAGRGQGPAP